MLGANQIYQQMTYVAQRYDTFKTLFTRFEQLATTGLIANDCPVKGIKFESQSQNNFFDAHFVGKCVRFAFSIEQDNQGWRGVVKCNLVDPVTKVLATDVGSFSLNGQGETGLKLPGDGDVINVNYDAHAAYLALHMLYEALGKK